MEGDFMNISDFPGVKIKTDINLQQGKPFKNVTDLEKVKSDKNFDNDTLDISNEAKDLLNQEKDLTFDSMEDESNMIAEMLRQLEEARDSENPYDSYIKCIQIAMRIMNGDEVPEKDKYFLLENQPQMYSNALLLRRPNEKPKKYDSLLENKKNDGNDIATITDFDMPSNDSSSLSISSDSVEASTTVEE